MLEFESHPVILRAYFRLCLVVPFVVFLKLYTGPGIEQDWKHASAFGDTPEVFGRSSQIGVEESVTHGIAQRTM